MPCWASGERVPPRARDADYRLLAENSKDVIFRIDAENRPVYVSPAAVDLLGWTPEEMIAAGPALIHPDDASMVKSVNDRLVAGEIREATVQCRMMNRRHESVWIEANARLIRLPDGSAGDVVMVMRDISERKRVEEELRRLAQTDGLTGLYNRRAFDEALDREWHGCLSEDGQMSLLMIDVDHFKRFNDLYGHQAGDECLKVIAATIVGLLDEHRVAARYGGEEIAIIAPRTAPEEALRLAETIRAHVEQLGVPHPDGTGAMRNITVSIGVATAFARMGATAQMPAGLVMAADNALYKAKQNGRNAAVPAVLLTAPPPSDGR